MHQCLQRKEPSVQKKKYVSELITLAVYYGYPMEIHKVIYTTNIIEGLNRQFRQITKQAVFYQWRFPTSDITLGLATDHEALARPLSELGSGTQPTGADVPSAGRWLILTNSPGDRIAGSMPLHSRLRRAYRGPLLELWSPRESSPDSALFPQRHS